jgi:hypothetical protein
MMAMMLFMVAPAQAQFSWGIKGGVNLASNDLSTFKGMNKEQVMNKDNYSGFFIGPKAEIRIPILGFGLEAAALYSQKGMTIGDNENFKQNSFLIPLNVKYAFGLGNFANVFIAAGPEFGFNMGETSKVFNNIKFDDVTNITSGDISAYVMEKSTLSINVGVGATLLNHLQVALNYNVPWGKTAEFQTISAEDIENVQSVDPDNMGDMTIGKFNDIKQSITNINGQYQNAMANIKAGTIQVSVAYLF